MITTRTAALITAMSLLGAVTPAAFAQVSIPQSQSNSAGVTSIPIAINGGGPGSSANANSNTDIDQEACQNAAGADRGSLASAFQNSFNLVGDDIDCS
jgi:uncharacterized membrane protein